MIKEIASYIETNTSFTIGTDLFVGLHEGAQDQCVVLNEFPDGENWSGMINFRLQVLARAKDYFTARADAYIVHELIKLTGFALINYVVMFSDILSMPQPIGRDLEGRFELSANYMLYIKEA